MSQYPCYYRNMYIKLLEHSFPRTSLHHNSTYIFKTSEFFLFKEEINVCEEQSETLSSDWIQTHVCPNFTLENSFEKLTKI